MTIVHVMQGLPASGKSTFARSLYPALRLNMDDMREMVGMTDNEFDKETEGIAFQAMLAGAAAAVKAGRDIVLDNVHVTTAWPRAYQKALGPLGVTFVVHSFLDVPIDTCIMRDRRRNEDQVGEEVIRKLEKRRKDAAKNGWLLTDEWMNGSGYKAPELYVADRTLPLAFICDIDGTIALHPQRNHYDYSKVSTDLPNEPVIEAIYPAMMTHKALFVSGRDESCRADTEEWICEQMGLANPPRLFMRADDDKRPDYLVKADLFDAHIRHRYNVRFVFDDRDQVVEHCWRAMGLTCLQVARGDF